VAGDVNAFLLTAFCMHRKLDEISISWLFLLVDPQNHTHKSE